MRDKALKAAGELQAKCERLEMQNKALFEALKNVAAWAAREPDSEHGLHLDGCALETDWTLDDDGEMDRSQNKCDCGRDDAIDKAYALIKLTGESQ